MGRLPVPGAAAGVVSTLYSYCRKKHTAPNSPQYYKGFILIYFITIITTLAIPL